MNKFYLMTKGFPENSEDLWIGPPTKLKEDPMRTVKVMLKDDMGTQIAMEYKPAKLKETLEFLYNQAPAVFDFIGR